MHVLSTPPAFILSQDQTLMFKCLILAPVKTGLSDVPLLLPWRTKFFRWKPKVYIVYYLLKVFVLWTILLFHFWNFFSIEFSGLHYCLFIKVLFACLICDSFYSLSKLFHFVKHFFILFFIFRSVPLCKSSSLGDKSYHITMPTVCQQEIVSFFTYFHFSSKTA